MVQLLKQNRFLISAAIVLFATFILLILYFISSREQAEFDVIVIGGEPEGVAAAVAAARNGAEVLLVAERAELGGLFTYGELNFLDLSTDLHGHSTSQGIFEEWHELVGRTSVFEIQEAENAFNTLVEAEKNLTVWTNAQVRLSKYRNMKINTVTIVHNGTEKIVSGKSYIDATQDADFAVLNSVPYFEGKQDIGIQSTSMAVTLMMHFTNVDWKGIKQAVDTEKFGPAYQTDTTAWGFVELHRTYEPKEANTRLRGLNIARTDENTVYINALQIFGVDGLDSSSKAAAIAKGKRETAHILEYLRKEFPGFEQAKIADFPEELYVRETRHIASLYQLPISDVWENKDHWDRIGIAAYPVDIQASSLTDYGAIVVTPDQFSIPFRSLVPQNATNLLVVGRSGGYSSLAAGSIRVVPTGMVTGEAAGTAASLAAKEQAVDFHQLSKSKSFIKSLQSQLKRQGAYFYEFELEYPYQGEWFYPALQKLLSYGLIKGGYTNDIKVDEEISNEAFIEKVNEAVSRSARKSGLRLAEPLLNVTDIESEQLMIQEAVLLLSEILPRSLSEDFLQRISASIHDLPDSVQERFEATNARLTTKDFVYIVGELMTSIEENQ